VSGVEVGVSASSVPLVVSERGYVDPPPMCVSKEGTAGGTDVCSSMGW
jgi:hypothetical protein